MGGGRGGMCGKRGIGEGGRQVFSSLLFFCLSFHFQTWVRGIYTTCNIRI